MFYFERWSYFSVKTSRWNERHQNSLLTLRDWHWRHPSIKGWQAAPKAKTVEPELRKTFSGATTSLTSDLFNEVVCSLLGDRVLESDLHSLFWASFDKSRVFLEVEWVCARVCKRACMSACMSACVGRLGLDWVNEWVSRQSITAGWPSALLWHKQKVHMAAGTHSHACTHAHTHGRLHWAGLSCPLSWSLLILYNCAPSRGRLDMAATCCSDDKVLTPCWTQQTRC